MTPDPDRILCRRCDRDVTPYEDICGGDKVKLCPHCHKRLGSAGVVREIMNQPAEVFNRLPQGERTRTV
jgi:predicted amidophosphoribosyltransferase